MSWNYRMIEIEDDKGEGSSLGIHEVYYDSEDGSLVAYIEHPSNISSWGFKGSLTTESDLRWQLDRMYLALNKPILKPEDFE